MNALHMLERPFNLWKESKPDWRFKQADVLQLFLNEVPQGRISTIYQLEQNGLFPSPVWFQWNLQDVSTQRICLSLGSLPYSPFLVLTGLQGSSISSAQDVSDWQELNSLDKECTPSKEIIPRNTSKQKTANRLVTQRKSSNYSASGSHLPYLTCSIAHYRAFPFNCS